MQQHRGNDAGTVPEDTCLHVPAEAAEPVALSSTCRHCSKSPNTQWAITGRELYSCKKGMSQLYFGFLLVHRFWVWHAFLLLKGSARIELNVHSFDLKIWTLKIKCNAVGMHFMRFSKAKEIVGWVFLRWMVFCGKLMLKTLVCLAMDIVLLLLCPSAYNWLPNSY